MSFSLFLLPSQCSFTLPHTLLSFLTFKHIHIHKHTDTHTHTHRHTHKQAHTNVPSVHIHTGTIQSPRWKHTHTHTHTQSYTNAPYHTQGTPHTPPQNSACTDATQK